MRRPLELAVLQLDSRPGQLSANAASIGAAAAAAGATVALTPELSLTGYDIRDLAPSLALPLPQGAQAEGALRQLGEATGWVIVGAIERGTDEVPYNSAVVLDAGRIRHVHRKVYLPTYGMFDEGRYFGRGRVLQPLPLPGGWLAGILICEDFWHPGLAYTLAAAGIDVLLVMAAAPGRGAWQGGEPGDFASADAWERITRTTAQLYGIYVALANRVGVEGGVTYAGGSLVAAPTGEVLARAPSLEAATLVVELDPEELARARRPAYHGRDDLPGLVAAELRRLGAA